MERQTPKDKVYIVQFDWATPDAEDVDLYVFGSYDKAYDKFKELICNERKPEMSWVGDIEFDDDGYPIDDRYEFSFENNNRVNRKYGGTYATKTIGLCTRSSTYLSWRYNNEQSPIYRQV